MTDVELVNFQKELIKTELKFYALILKTTVYEGNKKEVEEKIQELKQKYKYLNEKKQPIKAVGL